MRIGLDISQIVYKGTGVSRFTEGLIKAVCTFDKTNEWIFFFSSLRQTLDNRIEKLIEDKDWKIIKMKIPPTALSIMWNDVHVLKIESLMGKLDWFISSDWTEPPADCKKATIVHDLVYLRYPETVDQLITKVQRKRLNWVNKESLLIFVDSQTTKEDLVQLLEIDTKRIIVNFPGIESSEIDRKALPKKPFVLTVGKIEPRKNLNRLIEAFEKLNQNNVELLIVGPQGWGENIKITKNVRFVGYVTDEKLHELYVSCLFFIYPSIWEGFGYPVLEAMNLGVPVATSDTSSLKEIGENSALFFNPMKIDEIKNTMRQLISDEELRKELSRKGKERAKHFTWKKYYDVMIKALW